MPKVSTDAIFAIEEPIKMHRSIFTKIHTMNKIKTKKGSLSRTLAGIALAALSCHLAARNTHKPHIVLIMCDDMGFSDLGCYGSEIKTPNIDRLAQSGVRFSQFKNTGRSCPSRAALLTGRYQHEAGMGWMAEVDEHRPGYRGQISAAFPTIAEILRTKGYATYMSGKWHVTTAGAYDRPNGSYPTQRGFDRYYGCLHGGGSYYQPKPIYNDLERIEKLPDDYYYTEAITDSAISFINGHNPKQPMFLYLAHYAPHLPLEAPDSCVAQCIDRYQKGYDVLRRERFERQQKLGLVPAGMELPLFHQEFGGKRPFWHELNQNQQQQWIRQMATYAAMIEFMDRGIGQVIETLKNKGMLENTVFLFLSDNGATEEGGFIGQLMSDLSNTPYRSYKKWCFQGGTSSPLIVTYGNPERNRMPGQVTNQPAHIIDLLPTCMELAGARYPNKSGLKKLEGKSLIPAITGQQTEPRTLFFEHQGSCAVIADCWKLVRANRTAHWELFNLNEDPFETQDKADSMPEKVEELETLWIHWATTHQVFPLEDRSWTERINFYTEKNPDQDGK